MTDQITFTTRPRLAWRVTIRNYDNSEIIYGKNEHKVRAKALNYLCNDSDVNLSDITATREYSADVQLPMLDPIVADMSPEEKHCLLHSYGYSKGMDPTKAGYRDYFYTRLDDIPLVALTERKLMKPMKGDQWGENMTYFVLTPKGKQVALSMIPAYEE